MKENVRVIGPMVFSPELNFTVAENNNPKIDPAEDKILNVIADCFQKKIDCIADGGRQVGLSEQEIDSVIAPVNKLLEAYIISVDTKANAVATLIESLLTIMLMAPKRLSEFTEDVQMSLQRIAIDEVIGKIENIIERKEKKND